MTTSKSSALPSESLSSDRSGPAIPEVEVEFVGDGAIPPDSAAEEAIGRIRQVRGIQRITALPDACMGNLEAPMSMVTEMREWLVPAVATNVMNCGVGVIDTGLQAADLSEGDIERLLQAIWNATRSPDYEITKEETRAFFLEGTDALRRMGVMDETQQESFEFGGNVLSAEKASRIDLQDLVPLLLRLLRGTRTPAHLHLEGNHFLEVQVVEDPMSTERLKRFGLEEGRVVLMVHMDHRITGGLNLHYVTRKKLRESHLAKRAAYALSKMQFHFSDPRKWAAAPERLRLYFLEHGLYPLHMESVEGSRYLDAHAIGTNYGYAGRGIIYRAAMDALHQTFGGDLDARILWDTNHESIRVRDDGDGPVAVVRKGAVECFPSRPAFLLGHYDVPCLLGECAGSAETAFSYDHGSKHVRSALGRTSDADPQAPTVARYLIPQGSDRFEDAQRQNPALQSRRPIDVLARRLEDRGALHPVAWLRPLANLSGA